MTNLTLAYKVRTYSTGTLGRAICNARTHHFVADDAGGEEVGAEDGARIVSVGLHVERLHVTGVVNDEHRAVKLLAQESFVVRPQILPPLDVAA